MTAQKVHKIIGAGADKQVRLSCGKEYYPGLLPRASTEWEHVTCAACLRRRTSRMKKLEQLKKELES